MKVKLINRNKTLIEKHSVPLKLKSEGDVLKGSVTVFEGLKKWHNNTFFAYGVNNITNSNKNTATQRKVFFINKIVVE